MAERFGDPLFEKVGELSVEGWIRWIEYFEIETKGEDVPEQSESEKIAEYYESRGGTAF